MSDKSTMQALIEKDWNENSRWKGVKIHQNHLLISYL